MATIMPEGEAIRSAVKWISAKLEEQPGRKLGELIQQAALNYDLSPMDTDFLLRFFMENPPPK